MPLYNLNSNDPLNHDLRAERMPRPEHAERKYAIIIILAVMIIVLPLSSLDSVYLPFPTATARTASATLMKPHTWWWGGFSRRSLRLIRSVPSILFYWFSFPILRSVIILSSAFLTVSWCHVRRWYQKLSLSKRLEWPPSSANQTQASKTTLLANEIKRSITFGRGSKWENRRKGNGKPRRKIDGFSIFEDER